MTGVRWLLQLAVLSAGSLSAGVLGHVQYESVPLDGAWETAYRPHACESVAYPNFRGVTVEKAVPGYWEDLVPAFRAAGDPAAAYPAIAKKMAMKFDGKFEFRWVTRGKIARTFGRADIGARLVEDSISRQIASVKSHLPALVDEVNELHPSPIYHDICAGIHRRIRQLERE